MIVGTGQTARLLLDRQLPAYEARLFTAVVVDAPPATTYAGEIMRRWLRLAKDHAEQAVAR